MNSFKYDLDEIRQMIRERVPMETYLTKSKSGLFCCPFCGSGTGNGGKYTGALKVHNDTHTFYCHACGKRGDVIDLEMNDKGIDHMEALRVLADRAGVEFGAREPADSAGGGMGWNDTISADTPPDAPQAPHSDLKESGGQTIARNTKPAENGAQDATGDNLPMPGRYREYIEQCIAHAGETDYFQYRGFTPETVKKYMLGYDPAADMIVIPYNPDCSYWLKRSTKGKTFRKPKTEEAGLEPVYNGGALYADQPCFIVEAPLDALSVIQAGGNAAAIVGAASFNHLLDQIDGQKPLKPLILCLDRDEVNEHGRQPGQEAQAKLKAALEERKVPYIEAEFDLEKYGDNATKDSNDLLKAAPEQFAADVRRNTARAEQLADELSRPDNTASYINTLMAHDLENFKTEIKTGYNNLDAKAGGLYSGLYVIAAISSLGKTTFCAQMADQIAESGHDVLYFSLEQSRLEMVTKSFARIMAQNNPRTAASSLSIRRGYQSQDLIQAQREYLQKVGNRLSVIEGNFNCNVSTVREYVKDYILNTGERPVVIIDYLQILQPMQNSAGRTQSTKEAVDAAITELKRVSREFGIVVIAISSVNRANYLVPISFEALKESGSIEYSADVVLGLQLRCLTESEFENAGGVIKQREIADREKAANPRRLQLVCLKNRYGISSFDCFFDYYPANDLFTVSSEPARPKITKIRH